MVSPQNPASKIKKVGIVGNGKMGSGIFFYLLDYPYDLVWVTSAGADTDKLAKQFRKRIRRSLEARIISQERYDELLRTMITPGTGALGDCDLVIEAIPEDLDLKVKLFAMLDKTVKPSAIFASSSSSINPSALIPGGESRQVAGLHFFYPVPLKNIVEITLAPSTSAETRLELESFLDSIKRRYITLEEPDSFILNKIFLDFQVEAFQVVHDGESTFLQMDQLVKKYFFAFGVFDFCDSVGLDTMKSAVVNYTAHYPDRKKYDLFLASLGSLVSAGKLGFKTHEGFHKYPLTEQPGDEPEHAAEIEDHLRQTWICACKKFTQSASVPVDQMNSALEEYFGIELSPFEKLLLNPPD